MFDPTIDPRVLVEKIKQVDEEEGWRLVECYGPLVVKVINRVMDLRMKRLVDAQDIAQDAWKSFFRLLPIAAIEQPENVVAFLLGIARNKLKMAQRHHLGGRNHTLDRERSLDGPARDKAHELPGKEPQPLDSAVAADLRARMRGRFTNRAREWFDLLADGWPMDAIAAKYGVCTENVRRTIVFTLNDFRPKQ